jgi:hypothetical protein
VGDADLAPGSTPQIKAPKGAPTSTPDANSATVEAADSVETVETAVAKVRTHLAAVQARKVGHINHTFCIQTGRGALDR